MSNFKRATKAAARLRLALIGPPGSGKTYTSIGLACCLGKKVAVIDTERGSASKYADLFAFDVLELADSFHPKRYVEAIATAAKAGYDALVIDSLSHAWIGKDGGLDLHDQAVARQKTKNTYTAWGDVTPHHMALVDAMIQCPMHLVVTMRSKVEYAQDKDANGRSQVRKIGTAPLMRDGVEYEFDVVADLDTDNRLVVTKTRCPALSGHAVQYPGQPLADTLKGWLGDGAAPEPQKAAPPPEKAAAPAPAVKSSLPADGVELHRRLTDYDGRLARQKLCQPGDLLRLVALAGHKKGYPASITAWSTPEQMQFAADEVKDVEARWRTPPPKPAAPPPTPRGQITPDQVARLESLAEEVGEHPDDVAAAYRRGGQPLRSLAEMTPEQYLHAMDKLEQKRPTAAAAE